MAHSAKQGKIAKRDLLEAYHQALDVYSTRPDYPFEADRFWSNVASVWDVFNEYNKHYDYGGFWSNQADTDALYGDYVRVMRDFWVAIEKFEPEIPKEKLPSSNGFSTLTTCGALRERNERWGIHAPSPRRR